MPADHTVTSRSASFATVLLVLVQLLHLAGGAHAPYVDVLLTVLVGATSAAWLELRRHNSVEARTAVGFLALLSAGGVLLAMTVGLPAQEPRPLTPLSGATLLLSVVVLALLAADQLARSRRRAALRRPGRTVQRRNGSPYAL